MAEMKSQATLPTSLKLLKSLTLPLSTDLLSIFCQSTKRCLDILDTQQ